MFLEKRRPEQPERRQVPRGGRREADVDWSVTCGHCGNPSGHAFSVTERGFYWTCASCARTDLIVLPPSDAKGPSSVVLWRLVGSARGPLVAIFGLCPGQGLQLVVKRGRSPIVSELFIDPGDLLHRSREIRQRLISQGYSATAV